jgi:hypothetical protein
VVNGYAGFTESDAPIITQLVLLKRRYASASLQEVIQRDGNLCKSTQHHKQNKTKQQQQQQQQQQQKKHYGW